LHSNVEPASFDVNRNGGPPASSVVSGAVVSTVNVRAAGVWSVCWVVSVARTSTVYVPSANGPNSRGDVQGAKASALIRHSNVAPASLEENVNCGVVSRVVPLTPLSIVVSGAVVSTVNVFDAGV
jgi:hypothetical protein